jgi:polysaccharide export outer membrane protein
VAEETPASWESGEEPKPADVVAYETDYVFGSGDIVMINIYELFNQGAMYSNQFVVTETGRISIPDVGIVEAAGLTESQLEEEIKQILSPSILKEPSVGVILMQSQSRVFSILGGGVPSPGRYAIPRYDYRLADALATAGGIGQFNISYVYVSRPITGQEELAPEDGERKTQLRPEGYAVPGTPNGGQRTEDPSRRGDEPRQDRGQRTGVPSSVSEPREEMLEVIAPYVVSSAEMVTDEELAEAALPESILDTRDENQASSDEDKEGRIEWIFQDGRWVLVQVGQPVPPPHAEEKIGTERIPTVERPRTSTEEQAIGWEQIGPGGGMQRRVIRIPADKLLSGDPRYNIVIRPGDNIHVPVDIIGEFCIMGNVNNQGFINITGRPMTLKMALAAAGGLGPLAWPKRCEVVRRIGKKREEVVMVDLDKIAMGEQPDFFIKPNDLINVGTHPTARWRAVMRNAFRATYGFGFIYDRNFADRDYGTRRPIPNWF